MHASRRSGSFSLGASFACALSLTVPGCASSSDDESSAAADQLSGETSYCPSMEVSALAASGHEAGHSPSRVLDNDLTTRWVEQSVGAWVQADLGVAKTLCGVGIAWYRGNLRTNAFQIRTSMDGVTFKTVFNARSSGARTTIENYDFPNVNARYVRLVVNENTETKYAAVTELRVRGVPMVRWETEPATGVTATSATLHGNFTWNGGDYGTHWFKHSDDGGSSWTETPRVSWGPMPSAGSKDVAATVSGLKPSTRHVFLSCGTWRGSAAACRDSSGALGTDYDAFTTTRASLTYKGVQVSLLGRPGTERPSSAQLRDANVGLVRVLNGFSPGLDFSEGASYINDIRANAGVEVCAELMQMSWAPGNLATDAQWRARVTAFVQAIDVGPDGAYEIMNEPGPGYNGGTGWNQVLHSVELAAVIIHQQRPGSTVLLGAAMDVDQQSLLSAANARAGFWRFVDGFAIHPYGQGGTHLTQLGHTVARLTDARNTFKEYLSTHPSQADLPMWITEMGWGVDGPAFSGLVCQQGTGTLAQREVEQKDMLLDIYERLWPRRVKSDLYLKNIGWFHWHDYGNLDSWAELCGLNRGRDETVALNDPSATIHTQRPSYAAFKAEPKSRSLP